MRAHVDAVHSTATSNVVFADGIDASWQRYVVAFFTPVLRCREVDRCLKPLAAQVRMGQLNDLFVARALYQALLEVNPSAWFALGWIIARVAEVRAQARPELGQLAEADPPTLSSDTSVDVVSIPKDER